MSGVGAEIAFDRATKRYPGRVEPAVRELTLTIPAGEICCLVGPSGAGKTTAMKMVNRLIDISEGDIRIGGTSVRSLDVTELRRGIGYVIQQVGLFPHMTVADNVATVPRLLGWPKQRIGRAGRRAARPRRAPGGRLPRALPCAALGRRAPAGRPRPGARRRPAGDADGRAVRRARPDHSRAPPARAPPDPARGAEDDRLRHARHRRGDPARRPDRDPPRGRGPRAVRHAGRPARATPPTSSSRASSAPTAGSSSSRCAGSTSSSSSL